MNHALAITSLALLTLGSAAHAQSVVLARSVLGSGGGSMSGAGLSLAGTSGQFAAGAATGDSLTFVGGFWGGGSQPPRCPADVDDGTGTGTPDGGVTIEDLLYYLAIFSDGDVRADLDDGSSTGTPDGGVTIEDLLYFLDRFQNGC
jgi:hypothetical protein